MYKDIDNIWKDFIKDRDEKSKKILVEYYYTLVIKIAKNLSKNFNYYASYDELASMGVEGLYRALESFDPHKGIQFEKYAYQRIKGSMIDGLRSYDPVPRSVRQREQKINSAIEKLESEKGRTITEKELLNYLDINHVDYYRNNEKYKSANPVSIDQQVNPDIENEENKKDFNLGLVDNKEDDPESSVLRKDFIKEVMNNVSSQEERLIIYYYYYESRKMKDIAKILNISEVKIGKMHRKILNKLQQDSDLEDYNF